MNTSVKCWVFLQVLIKVAVAYVFDSNYGITVTSSETHNDGRFGYSLDMLKTERNVFLFVGAPKDRVRQTGEVQGTFHVCNIDIESGISRCDSRTPTMLEAQPLDDYMDQMLGVVVQAKSGPNQQSQAWTCAPRFTRHKEKYWAEKDETLIYRTMLGQCFEFSESDNFKSNRHVIPLQDKPFFFDRWDSPGEYAYGTVYAQAGMSIHLTDNDVLFGAPGSWNWTGSMVVGDLNSNDFVMTQPWADWEPILNDYAGYALTTGQILRRSSGPSFRPRQFVVGAPRAGKERTGSVFIVEYNGTETITRVKKLNGAQTGEYFGAALVCADVNGDGLDEILVGSPLFTNEVRLTDSIISRFEEGRVSIFQLDEASGNFLQKRSIYGNHGSSRFGHAIQNLGDLDGDGFEDFAVGSPYEDEGRGRVRIFYGKKNIESIQEPGQVLVASEINRRLMGFGVAISSPVDIDSNGVKDIAIGSHTSGHAIVLRGRPSAHVEFRFSASVEYVDVADPKDFELQVCTTLLSARSYEMQLSLESNLIVRADNRSHFLVGQLRRSFEKRFLKLFQNNEACETFKVGFKENFHPYAQEPPLTFEVEVEAMDYKGESFCKSCAVLDPRTERKGLMRLRFQSACQSVCVSDISVDVMPHDEPFLIGSQNVLGMTFLVMNIEGDPAFQPRLKVPIPEDLIFIKSSQNCRVDSNGRAVICDLPGAILQNKRINVPIDFDVSKLVAGQTAIHFDRVEAYSGGSNDLDMNNNRVSYTLDLLTQVDVAISGRLDAERITMEKEDMTRDFSQTFQVQKYLSSPVEGVETKFSIPTALNGLSFLTINNAELLLPGSSQRVPCRFDKNIVYRTSVG